MLTFNKEVNMDKELVRHVFILIIIFFFLSNSCKGYTLTTSSDKATVGLDYTFTCVTTEKLLLFNRDNTDICTITDNTTDGTCVFSGGYITDYSYTCNPTTNTYTVTIPGPYLTESLHGTRWRCQDPFGGGVSNTKILYVNDPISSATLLSTPTDKNPVEVVSNRDQTFSCKTNAARPPSRIQWYLSTTNITTSASTEPDICNTDCSDDKVISYSLLTYRGNLNDSGKIVYCTAVNIEGMGVVRSSNKTIVIWYGPNEVIITPSTQSYTLNETENLNPIQCTAVCIPNCTMTWSGPNLPADTTSVLNLLDINRNQKGSYQCTASNDVSNQTSVEVNVVVQYGPNMVIIKPSTQSYTLNEKENLNQINCTADCIPVCTMTWSGPTLPIDTTSLLNLQNINRNQTGNYQCTASNDFGSNTSVVVNVTVQYGPNLVIITPSIQSYTLNETENLTQIQCTADCIPVCKMTWSGPNLPADTTSVLNLQNINRNQTGNYECTASNDVSNKTSVVVNVVVQHGPNLVIITPSTQSYTLKETDNLNQINCTADCIPNCTMTWSGPNIPAGTKSVLNLQNITRNQAGDYQCTASNDIGSMISVIVTIIVNYSPTVNINNTDPLDVVENVTLKLVCRVLDANPTVNSFSWYKGSSTTAIGMKSNFSISNVIRTDSGVYRCEGSNGIGQNGIDTVYVNVLYHPAITHLSVIDANEIVENNTATIQCKVESYPPSDVEWTFENDTVYKENSGVLQSNYTIQRAECVNTGFYMCTATNTINMESYSDKQVVQLLVKCSPRRDTTFGLPENQIGLAPGQHLKMQIHIIAYPPPFVEWQFRSADNSTTETLSSNCNQTNMFKHTACFEKDNVTEGDFGKYSIFVHNGLGNNFSYLFNVDPQGPPDMSSNVNTSCKVASADIMWTTGFHGGEKQQFYVIVLEVKTRITKIYNTHVISNEKNEDKSYNIALQPGLYSFRMFGNNSFGDATSGESTCQVNNVASESDPVIAVAAGTGSAAAALIIGVVVVIVVLRKRMANAKGNENSDDKGRVNMTSMDGDGVVEGLQENDCYVPFQPKDTGAANYEVVERKDQSNANDVKQDSQETALYSIVDKKPSAKGATTSGEKTKHGPDENGDVYENFTNKGSSDNQKQNVNKDGLQYSELVFNPLPNGSKFIIHGIEDTTIYAEVDTTQKIDPLPESDDEDKGKET